MEKLNKMEQVSNTCRDTKTKRKKNRREAVKRPGLLNKKAPKNSKLNSEKNVSKKRDVKKLRQKNIPKKSTVEKAIVKRAKGFYLYVELKGNRTGRIHITEISDSVTNGFSPLTRYKRGQELVVRTLGVSSVKRHSGLVVTRAHVRETFVDCSLKLSVLDNGKSNITPSFAVGDTLIGYVCGHGVQWVYMWLSQTVKGRVNLLNLSHSVKDVNNYKKHFRKGHAFNVHIIGQDEEFHELSIIRPDELKIGAVVPGRILSTRRDLGLFIKLPLGYRGRVHLTDMCDEYQHSALYLADFERDKIVKCSIISIDSTTKDAVLSLRKSRIDHIKDLDSIVDREYEWSDMQIHKELRGYVTGIAKTRLFIDIARNVLAICPLRSGIPSQLKSLGAAVNVQITKLEKDNKVSGNILVTDEDLAMEAVISIPDEMPIAKVKRSVEMEPKLKGKTKSEKRFKKSAADSSTNKGTKENKELAHLEVPTGFVWDLNNISSGKDAVDSSEDEDDSDKPKTRKKRQAKFFEEMSEEDRLRQTELTLIDTTHQPESVDDFDKMVLASPNSSIIWLKYMAFHLQSTEIDKARAVTERALKTISFREEQEKLNIWVAFLNLENLYGTRESMQKVLQRALQYNDPLKVYKHVINIYIQSDKHDSVEQVYGTLLKKFSTNTDVWISYGTFLMKNGQQSSAHKLMDRSLKSLHKKDHLSVISKFAQLEFKYGDPQRANTLFESMLTNYPRRADIWSVYVDVLVKTGDIEKARDIYKKALTIAATFKNMKFFFRKYFEFERLHGNEETLNEAREKLMEFEQTDESAVNIDNEDE